VWGSRSLHPAGAVPPCVGRRSRDPPPARAGKGGGALLSPMGPFRAPLAQRRSRTVCVHVRSKGHRAVAELWRDVRRQTVYSGAAAGELGYRRFYLGRLAEGREPLSW